MKRKVAAGVAGSILFTGVALGQMEVESVYAPPTAAPQALGVNAGGVSTDFTVNYLTDYIYRGIDFSEVGGREDAANLQFDGTLEFDLDKFPHPQVGLFANVYDSDPMSRFQEIRPFVGAEWTLRPLILSAGHTNYIYPEREEFNRAEIWGKVAVDDSLFWKTDRPVLAPYVLGAYDYDLNRGWYLEAGVRHDFLFEDVGLTLSPLARIAYVQGIEQIFVFTNPDETGFQHYDVGLISSYSLNTLLNVSRRFGEWSLMGYLFYTEGLGNLLADTEVWGGAGIRFQY